MSIVDDALQTLGKSTGPTQALNELGRAANPMARSVAHELYRGGAPAAPGKPWALWAAGALLLLGATTWWLLDRAKPAVPAAPAYPVAALAKTPAALPATVLATTPVALAPITRAAQMVEAEKQALPTMAAPAWLSNGWQQADASYSDQALDTWQAGLSAEGPSRYVIYALAFKTLPMALAQARLLHATAPALVVRANNGTEPRFRVLLMGETHAAAQAIKIHLLPQAPYLWVAPAPRLADKAVAASQAPPATAVLTLLSPAGTPAASPPATASVAPGSADRAGPTLPPKTGMITPLAAVRVDVQFSVDDSATKALDALGRNDLAEAGKLAEVLISKQPNRWEGYFVKGSALLAGGHTREAEAPLERALELQPNSVRVLLQRAIAAQESGQPGRAVDLLRRAKSIAPDNPAVWLNLGYSAELSNANDEAVAAYQRYLQISTISSGADSQRAYVSERLRILGKP